MDNRDTIAIKALVERYREISASGKVGSYNEEETKKDFILPLFEALGWEVYSKKEVSAEEHQSGGRVDYGFLLNGRVKFYLEAKALKADLNREDFAKQAIRYSWNKGITWAVLTDFESLKVFNAQVVSENLANKLFFELQWDTYLENIDQLALLSKQAFTEDLLDKQAEKWGKKLPLVSVTSSLYKDLNYCREKLTTFLGQQNPQVDQELLDEGVQKLLDRLLFIRVAEDRGIEDKTLIPLLREWQSSKTRNEIPLYQSMVKKFRELDKIYNSNLFTPHPFEDWEDYSDATKDAIETLYGKEGYYEYDFKVIPSDVLGTVYENYLGYKLQKSKKGLTVGKDASKRKEQGIYYTPSYIVDYIVDNALKPVLDRCTSIEDLQKIKVLDPACGSGSFLIKALDMIFQKYREFGNLSDEEIIKTQILLQNIYGVDLDPQAVEIARLNLLINSLSEKMQLPSLSKNIKNGNSLISGTGEELKKYFGPNFRDKKPFNWEEEFPEVFSQGGFDVIVGNPPYIQLSMETNSGNGLKDYLLDRYKFSMGRLNTFGFFTRCGIELLKDNGSLGFIIPNTVLTQDYYEQLRTYILNTCAVNNIALFDSLPFNDAVVENVILIVKKLNSDIARENNTVTVQGVNNKLIFNNRGSILQRLFDQSYNHVFNIHLNNKQYSLQKKVETNTQHLSNFLSIHQAIALKHDRAKYIGTIKVDSRYKPLIDGRDINRYFINWNGKYLLYDINSIHSCKREDIFLTKEKLFFRRVGDRLVAAYDNKQLYALNTLVVMNKREHVVENINFFLSLFNSKLLNWYYKNFLKSNKKVFSEIQARQVAMLPIRSIGSGPDCAKIHDEIVPLVEKLTNLKQVLIREAPNSEKFIIVRDEIVRIDSRIDKYVYELYGLTEEEIKIVENS